MQTFIAVPTEWMCGIFLDRRAKVESLLTFRRFCDCADEREGEGGYPSIVDVESCARAGTNRRTMIRFKSRML